MIDRRQSVSAATVGPVSTACAHPSSDRWYSSESPRDVARRIGVRTVRHRYRPMDRSGESVVTGPMNRCRRRISPSTAIARSFDTKTVWEYRLPGPNRWRHCRRSGSSYPESLLTIGRRRRPLVDIIHSRPIPHRPRSLTSGGSGRLRTALRALPCTSRSLLEPVARGYLVVNPDSYRFRPAI